MEKPYWNGDSFGSGAIPANWEAIIDEANSMIDAYAETHDPDAVEQYSESLFEAFCSTGNVGRVSAAYEED